MPAERLHHLFGAGDDELEAHGVMRMTVDSCPGFPCRISLEDVTVGETVLLLNDEHQPVQSTDRFRHAIFVREGATQASPAPGGAPDQRRRRLLSIQAFDADDMIIDADVVDGRAFERPVETMLADPKTHYLHVHHAGRGCYAARVGRA